MKLSFRERALENINRVRNLVAIYEMTKGNGHEFNTDVLRAAVVLLHAALEDCIRSLSYERLPLASPQELHKTEQRVQLGKIAEYRGRPVDDLISDVVFEHLGRVTYNNSGDIVKALASLRVKTVSCDPKDLDIAIKRRHEIVHRADRVDRDGGAGMVSPIQASHVLKWTDEVEAFVTAVVSSSQSGSSAE